MLFIHFANVYLADLTEEDPCSLYLINFLLDATVGMLLIYVGVRAVSVLVEWQQWESLRFGEYGDPLQCGAWVGQCALYIVIMIFEKSVVFIVLLILQWKKVALLNPIENPDLKLAIVMLIVPFFVNALMFWVVDNFLMRKGRTKAKLEERGANQDSRNGSKVRYRRAASHEESESEVGPSPHATPRPEEVPGLCLHLVFPALAGGRTKRLTVSIQQGPIPAAPGLPTAGRWSARWGGRSSPLTVRTSASGGRQGKEGLPCSRESGKDCPGPDRGPLSIKVLQSLLTTAEQQRCWPSPLETSKT
ncbi:store-operated calcium entry regulator STIMATE isoform X2 [Phoca vitulina]|nr:store-operated calcium entry regulator STIMATE isoform X2 [Phoca vitulina]